MLVCAVEIPMSETDAGFTDTKPGMWHYKYIATAYANGIASGIDESLFGVDKNITRQEMAVMLQRAAKAAGISTTDKIDLVYFEDPFVDRDEIASWASSSITTLYKAGFISGVGNGRFAPNATATRAQAAQMIYNVLKSMEGRE